MIPTELTERINFSGNQNIIAVLLGNLQARVNVHRIHRFGLFDGSHRAFVDARHERVDTRQAAPDRRTHGQGPVVVFVVATVDGSPFGEQDASCVAGQKQRDRKRGINAAGHNCAREVPGQIWKQHEVRASISLKA